MNERIKELILEATSPAHRSQGFGGEPTHIYQGKLDPEKFAELIVRECAKFLDENSGSDQCNNVWYPTPEEMLQHFGVEE